MITSDELVKSLAIFLSIDLLLRQTMSRLDLISQWRIESLASSIRPALRITNRCLQANNITTDEIDSIICLVEKIRPLPPKKGLEMAEKVKRTMCINELKTFKSELEKELEKHRTYATSFIGPLGALESALGISISVGLVINGLFFAWIPALFLWVVDIIPTSILIITIAVAFLSEMNLRRGKRIPWI